MTKKKQPDDLISVAEAAPALGVTKHRVHQLIRDGRLPATRIANAYAVRRRDLALVADRKPGRPRST